MKNSLHFGVWATGMLLASVTGSVAAVLYVDGSSVNPVAPYTNWTTAARVIQEAVDVAVQGDEVVVTNGTYSSGGRAVATNLLPNRVVVDKPITLRSVNGPGFTQITGVKVAGTYWGTGQGATRCVFLAAGATLSGFTLTNGATGGGSDDRDFSGGGVWCDATNSVVTNCVLVANAADDYGGAVIGGTLYNCVLANNSGFWYGGAAAGGVLNSCTLRGNTSGFGGGAYQSTLNNCTLTNNTAQYGGGAYGGVLNDCDLIGNGGRAGGGAAWATLNNCRIIGNCLCNGSGPTVGGGLYGCIANHCLLQSNNAASGAGAYGDAQFPCTLNECTLVGNYGYWGGGADSCTLNNCVLTGNDGQNGGGAYKCTLNNCTLDLNSARTLNAFDGIGRGGGALESTLNNCIAYYNTAAEGANYMGGLINYSCTTPLPPAGIGNTDADPQLTSASHVSAGSPCRGAGSAAYVSGTDIDGEAWGSPPSMGCDEFHAEDLIGPLQVSIAAGATNTLGGDHPLTFTALIDGRAAATVWDFGDGSKATNLFQASHAWLQPGDYTVVLRAFNQDEIAGASASVVVHVTQGIYYVASDNPTPVAPYLSWATAAGNIQDAIDAAATPGVLVLVTNGTYATGGRPVAGSLTNRVAVDRPLIVRSVNGPQVTVIQGSRNPGSTNGDTAVRCAYLGGGATLSGFTLTNGATRNEGDPINEQSGGGVWCDNSAVVSNCIITGNSAASAGGGAYAGALFNCQLSGNAALQGGGVSGAALVNCTVTGNNAVPDDHGNAGPSGGVSGCALTNCIVYFNTGANFDDSSSFSFSCSTPLPGNGVGNIDLDPQLASASHLSTNSPCRGMGDARYAVGTDIDGEPWLNPPSMGCDEYHAGTQIGPLTLTLVSSYTYVATGYFVQFSALIEGRVSASVWDFGDGSAKTNQPFVNHFWTTPGTYEVVLRASNETYPKGISATVEVRVENKPTHYVVPDSLNPVAPYSSWSTAARTIQDAVDAGALGGTVLVTNGIYATGGRAVYGTLTNRVTVDKHLAVRSVNGANVTVIEGWQVPWTTNGDSAIRCVYLADGTSVSGFTLTRGATRNVGTVRKDQEGGGVYAEADGAVVADCVLAGNSAASAGGGAFGGTVNNCALTGNSAVSALSPDGGAGGGACRATLNNCVVTGNSAFLGGGVSAGVANNCTITGNAALGGILGFGGAGGGASGTVLNNCIVYFNKGPVSPNYDGGILNFCCATPLPANGIGNIDVDPQLASASHLGENSPCRGAGSSAYATGTDIDGDTWASPPSIGCDEYQSGLETGPLSALISATITNVAVGYPVDLIALIDGQPNSSIWDFGDGSTALNQPYVTHTWTAPGDFVVTLRADNESEPGDVTAVGEVHVKTFPLQYVSANSLKPVAPYTSWPTAASTIQDAIDAGIPGGTILVTNGVYSTGGRAVFGAMTNRVVVDKALSLRSVNGPQFTTIVGWQVPGLTNGDGAVRCVLLANGASLAGFTLTNGATRAAGDVGFEQSGGGAWCESTGAVLSGCVLSGNSAFAQGGGVYLGTLNNCVVAGNTAGPSSDQTNGIAGQGGGVYGGILNNCTLTANSALGTDGQGGGCANGHLYNSIVYFNDDGQGGNYDASSTLDYCCTTPLPPFGSGNFNLDPLFQDQAGANLRLQSNSPCINAGNNSYVGTLTDLDGIPRLVGGTVDLGAFEFPAPTSTISYSWLQQYGLPSDGSIDRADPDGDGLDNWQEWRTGTDPTNGSSILRLLPPLIQGESVTVSWQSVAGVSYFLERGLDFGTSLPLFSPLAVDIPGQAGTTSFIDTRIVGAGPVFYRVGVSLR